MDFDIEKSTGSMVIARPLDARKKSSYNLTVEVTDGSSTIKTQVIYFFFFFSGDPVEREHMPKEPFL